MVSGRKVSLFVVTEQIVLQYKINIYSDSCHRGFPTYKPSPGISSNRAWCKSVHLEKTMLTLNELLVSC